MNTKCITLMVLFLLMVVGSSSIYASQWWKEGPVVGPEWFIFCLLTSLVAIPIIYFSYSQKKICGMRLEDFYFSLM